jgi:peptidoglycan hydrolase-like protein with peptidoglycan-binding domain
MSTRLIFATFFSILLCGFFTTAASAEVLSTTLRFGDNGSQVFLLQQLLNQSPDTEVATSGIGSPGMESSYFGAKTLDAVKRYQNKYSAEILVPAGLAVPSGIVGPLTLAMLQKGVSASATTSAGTATSAPPTVSTSSAAIASSTSPINQYIAAVKQLGVQQGYSSSTLALITAKIVATAASTSDYQAKFYKEQQALYQKQASLEISKPFAQKIFDIVVASAKRLLMPDIAQAGAGLPFGGFVTYSNPLICDCPPGVVTSIFVSLGAPTPTSNLLLNYTNGTEAFNWHTLPAPGVATLGIYEPGVQSCWTYTGDDCVLVPAVGTITPEAGSSLVP